MNSGPTESQKLAAVYAVAQGLLLAGLSGDGQRVATESDRIIAAGDKVTSAVLGFMVAHASEATINKHGSVEAAIAAVTAELEEAEKAAGQFPDDEGQDEEQDEWQVAEGTGWIPVPGFGRINPRRDDVMGGRQYFDALLDNGEYAQVIGDSIRGGPTTWYFEFDSPFFLADRTGRCVELEISLLEGGRYCVKYRRGVWPPDATGGW